MNVIQLNIYLYIYVVSMFIVVLMLYKCILLY